MFELFTRRPKAALVIALGLAALGALSMLSLPIAQYPAITPPVVNVQAVYTGADAVTVEETVTTPIEVEVNGTPGLSYVESNSTNQGVSSIDLTFELGTDIDIAALDVQNRVSIAEPTLPEAVTRLGVTVRKRNPGLFMLVGVRSPGGTHDVKFLDNYTNIFVKDALLRVPGVGDAFALGKDFSMRLWLDPQAMASYGLTPEEVIAAIREQNVQVAAGTVGAPPQYDEQAFQYALFTDSRLEDPAEFADVILRQDPATGALTRLSDVGRVELGTFTYGNQRLINGEPASLIIIFQAPGSNALATYTGIVEAMDRLAESFPPDLEYVVPFESATVVEVSIREVAVTLAIALGIVALIVFVFLQRWRTSLIPVLAIPVSILGTFIFFGPLGFTINTLTLFGFVLAIGIVVDDSIVVVEAIQSKMDGEGLAAKPAAVAALREVTAPVITTSLILVAIFLPSAFIPGLTGQLYQQFAVTISVSVLLSSLTALTLAPALSVLFFDRKGAARGGSPRRPPHEQSRERVGEYAVAVTGNADVSVGGAVAGFSDSEKSVAGGLGVRFDAEGAEGARAAEQDGGGQGSAGEDGDRDDDGHPWLDKLFGPFNRGLDGLKDGYGRAVRWTLAHGIVTGLLFGAVCGAAAFLLLREPSGVIPTADEGRVFITFELPESASNARTLEVMEAMTAILDTIPEIADYTAVASLNAITFTDRSNTGTIFTQLRPWGERTGEGQDIFSIVAELNELFGRAIVDARVVVIPPPPIPGLGSTSGFSFELQDRSGEATVAEFGEQLQAFLARVNEREEIEGAFSFYTAETPAYDLSVDRVLAKRQGIPLSNIYSALQTYIGSAYVNNFTLYGRTFRVVAQADTAYRREVADLDRVYVRNGAGEMVPLSGLLTPSLTTTAPLVTHYNLFRSAPITGNAAGGFSSGQVIAALEEEAADLPRGYGYAFSGLTAEQVKSGAETVYIFGFSIAFAFLILVALYESWTIPFSVLAAAPVGAFGAALTLWLLSGIDLNVYAQIGLLTVVGLAAKNAILIVEFAKKKFEEGGMALDEATVAAARERLRPILMTSATFVFGMIPLVTASGAGANSRQTIGWVVIGGMLAVTAVAILFVPFLYWRIARWVTPRESAD